MASQTKRRGPKTVSKEHKAAMAAGRAESRVVSQYLEALTALKPRRGPRRTPEIITARLEAVEAEYEEAGIVSRLALVQERMDLEAELTGLEESDDISGYEQAFVEVAYNYSARKGISYNAWREIGVSAAVLREAGISRSGR